MSMDGFDMNALLAQAQQMQQQMQSAQDELASSVFTGTAGGDSVTATMNGNGELIGLVISPEVIDPSDAEGLADLVIAAVRAATSQLAAKAAQIMPQIPGL
jgi:nucleoid-associated protein EbfC